MDTTPDEQPQEETWDDIPSDVKAASTEEISTRSRLIDNDVKVREEMAMRPYITSKILPVR